MKFDPVRSDLVCSDVRLCVQRIENDVMPTIGVRELTDLLAKMSGHEIENIELSYCGKVLHPDQALQDCVGRSGETLHATHKEGSLWSYAQTIQVITCAR